MSLPTSGYTPATIEFFGGTQTGLTTFGFAISIGVDDVGGQVIAEQIAAILEPVLADVLADIKSVMSAPSAQLDKVVRGRVSTTVAI